MMFLEDSGFRVLLFIIGLNWETSSVKVFSLNQPLKSVEIMKSFVSSSKIDLMLLVSKYVLISSFGNL